MSSILGSGGDLEALFRTRSGAPDMMSGHMAYVRGLCGPGDVVLEFGVRRANSTVAFLASGARVVSVDLDEPPLRAALTAMVGERWEFRHESSLETEPFPHDVLFHDSLHNYDHVKAELERHGPHTKRLMIFHDTVSHGEVGQTRSCGPAIRGTRGIMDAIEEWLDGHRDWKIANHRTHHAGLMTLCKTSP